MSRTTLTILRSESQSGAEIVCLRSSARRRRRRARPAGPALAARARARAPWRAASHV